MKNTNNMKTAEQTYAFYSRVLKEPFDSIEELTEAEEAYYAKLKAKETKAAAKKADAQKVEDAFVALNAARKNYKEELQEVTSKYSADLAALKSDFEKAREKIYADLAAAEDTYSTAIKAFTEKYPEGYHLTLKDGDFETTISGSCSHTSKPVKTLDFYDWLFKGLNDLHALV